MTLAVPGALEFELDGAERIAAALGGELRIGPRLTDREFAERYLKGTSLFPADSPARWQEPAPVHAELSQAANESTLLILEVSRDFAKSTWALILILRTLCEHRNTRVLISSKTAKAAEALARPIRQQLEGNARLVEDYGPFKGPKWTDEEFTILRSATFKETTVRCVGRGGQIVSARYDIVVLDDIEDFESTRNAERMGATQQWVERDVLPTVSQGRVLVIETPQADGDLPNTLAKNPLFRRITRPAEEPTREGEPGEPGVAWLRRRSNWPARWPVYWNPSCGVAQAERQGGTETKMAQAAAIACVACPIFNPSKGETGGRGCLTGKRFQIGPLAYRLQYGCDRGALGGDLFKEEWFRVYQPHSPEGVHWHDGRWWFRTLPLTLVFGLDPAVADEGEKNPDQYSRFALVVLGVHKATRLHVLLHYLNIRVDYPTQLIQTEEQITQFWPEIIGIEEVLYQRALRQDIQKMVTRIRKAAGPTAPHITVRGVANVIDKTVKFNSLTPEVQQGLFWIGPNQQEFLIQATRFPRASHDDLLDGYYYAKKVGLGITPMFEDVGATERMAAERAKVLAEHPHVAAPQLGVAQPGEWTKEQLAAHANGRGRA